MVELMKFQETGKNFKVFKFSIQQLWKSIIIIFKLSLILTTSELSWTINVQWQQKKWYYENKTRHKA